MIIFGAIPVMLKNFSGQKNAAARRGEFSGEGVFSGENQPVLFRFDVLRSASGWEYFQYCEVLRQSIQAFILGGR